MKYSKEKIQQFADQYHSGTKLIELSVIHNIPYDYLRRIIKPFIKVRQVRVRIRKNNHDTFLKRIKIVNECWEWQGYKNNKGYGQFSINGKLSLAHRYSYSHYKGNCIDKFVCHSCDNPKCVNPDHLFLGNYLTNVLDCLQKGRKPTKLKEQDIPQIRSLIKTGLSGDKIAKMFNVCETTIKAVRNGTTWKWVK
jgi:hypothetical protein